MVVDPPDGQFLRFCPKRAIGERSNIPGDYKSLSEPLPRRQLPRRAHDARPLQQQLPDRAVGRFDLIMLEMVHDVRIVHMNAKHKPANVRQWFGDSIGHWEGDTLVVETTNFTARHIFRGSSKNLKVTERFTRVDDKTIEYHATWTIPPLGLGPGRSNCLSSRAGTDLRICLP